jgi:hypothetical protein
MLAINGSKLVINSKLQVAKAASSINYLALNDIATYLRNNINDLKNPDFFSYNLDGNSYSITDDGNDMFDAGNFTAPWFIAGTDYTPLTSIPTANAINYSNVIETILDTNFQYISLGYGTSPDRRPLLAVSTFLSKPTPSQIPLTDVQAVVTTYTAKIKTALGY